MIRLENISFKYDKLVLDNINTQIDKTKITFIIGANGSGKTTLASIMSGLLFASSGKVFIDDIELNKKTNHKLLRKKIGIVFQNPSNQILFSKVYDDINFTLENVIGKTDDNQKIIADSLSKVGMLDSINSNPYTLSGGMKQRIAIASQLSLSPDYLIFDEATSMLDINGKNDIYKLIKKLKKEMGIIFISNDINEIIYADDVLIVDKQKVYKYTLDNILNDNSILTKHNLDIPFILKLANLLHIKNSSDLKEEIILKKVGNND